MFCFKILYLLIPLATYLLLLNSVTAKVQVSEAKALIISSGLRCFEASLSLLTNFQMRILILFPPPGICLVPFKTLLKHLSMYDGLIGAKLLFGI